MELGFIGLGVMGAAMAERLIANEHEVLVYDVRPDAVAALVALGAEEASGPRDVADRAPVILASLPTPIISEQVASDVAMGGAARLFVELSTIGRGAAVRSARLLAASEIAYLDAPISGGVRGAVNGSLTAMVAGPAAQLETVDEALGAFTASVVHVGAEPGQAQIVKLANNILSATAIIASAEAVLLAVRAGVDPHIVVDTISKSTGRNSAINDKFAQFVLPRTFDSQYRLGLIAKDVRLCLDAAQELHIPMLVGRQTEELFSIAESMFGGSKDSLDVIRVIEEWAGVVIDGDAGRRSELKEA